MKNKSKIFIYSALILVFIIALGAYLLFHDNKHINNRCTPVGDPREATIDCFEFKYYDPAADSKQ